MVLDYGRKLKFSQMLREKKILSLVVKFEAGKRGSASAKPGPRRPDDGLWVSCGGALAGLTGRGGGGYRRANYF